MAEREILRVRSDVEFRYEDDERVCYVVPSGLAIHAGESWCVRGVSGSGKSTLMTLLAALRRFTRGCIVYRLTDEPEVEVAPESWGREVGPSLWRRIGFAFQRPELIRALNVADNLALAAATGEGPSLFEDDEWRRISRSRVWEISGGQIQRLGLMRAFGSGQDLVFLDEPTNNLDRRNRATVADYVASRRSGRGLILVSHDDEFIETLDIDRVLEIHEQPASDDTIRRVLVETAWRDRPSAAADGATPGLGRLSEVQQPNSEEVTRDA